MYKSEEEDQGRMGSKDQKDKKFDRNKFQFQFPSLFAIFSLTDTGYSIRYLDWLFIQDIGYRTLGQDMETGGHGGYRDMETGGHGGHGDWRT